MRAKKRTGDSGQRTGAPAFAFVFSLLLLSAVRCPLSAQVPLPSPFAFNGGGASGGAIGGASNCATAGQVLYAASAGVATCSVGMTYSVATSGLTLGGTFANGNAEVLTFKTQDMNFPIRQFAGLATFGTGQIDNTWSIQFNLNRVSTLHPQWSENIEDYYVTGGGQKLLEKNWAFTSIDNMVQWRPFNFSIDLDTNIATQRWLMHNYDVIGPTQTIGQDEALHVHTATKHISTTGGLQIGLYTDVETAPLVVTGPTVNGTAVLINPTTLAAGDTMLSITPAAVTGSLRFVDAESTVTTTAQINWRNFSGGVQEFLWGGSTGDVWMRMLGSADWSYGVDRANAGNFEICQNGTLGTNCRLTITPAGAVSVPGIFGATGLSSLTGGAAFPVAAGITYKAGANARVQSGTLSGGTLALANTSITANSKVFCQDTAAGSLVNVGPLVIASKTAGVGFTVTSGNALDTSTFDCQISETN